MQRISEENQSANNSNKWTVLVYMASDNTLSEESAWALTEMREVGAEAGVNVVALFDSDARGVPTKKFILESVATGEGAAANLKKKVPLVLAGEDFSVNGIKQRSATALPNGITRQAQFEQIFSAANPRVLRKFLKDVWQDSRFKAPRNMLILSGHGSGSIGDFLTGNDPALAMSIPRVGKEIREVLALSTVKKNFPTGRIDILGLDSCLMSMVEICYELRDSVDFLISAEGFEPETGWPYHLVLQAVNDAAKNKTLPEDLACRIAEEYVNFYKDYAIAGISVDQAVCDLRNGSKKGSKMSLLITAIAKLAKALMAKIKTPQLQDLLVLAHWKAQSYKSEQYVDLWDFCDLLQKSCGTRYKEIRDACREVKNAINPEFVLLSSYYGTDAQHSHGVSIYFPWKDSAELDAYQGLHFSEETSWGTFLKDYVRETQRKVRGEGEVNRNKEGEVTTKGIVELHITSAASPLLPSANSMAGIKNPPDTGKNPPDTGKNKFALRSNMKNSPTSFLVRKETGEVID